MRTFRTTKDMAESMNLDSYGVRLFSFVPDRIYGPLVPGSLRCIISGDDVSRAIYDIVVFSKSGFAQRVSKFHVSYMSLHYSLLFSYGEDGRCHTLHMRTNSDSGDRNLSNNMFYSY